MRGNRSRPSSRPTSRHGGGALYTGVQPIRKVFNCIIDDTALVAGVKKSTRNGIRQWVKNGQIRLFVPLHALEQLSRQKNGTNRHAEDVRETLQWLDDATSKYPHAVTLQGGDQYYSNWSEVEQFAVPRTLFSEHDHVEDEPEIEDTEASLTETTQKMTLTDRFKTPSSAGSDGTPRSMSPSSLQSMHSSFSQVSPPTSPTKTLSSPIKHHSKPSSSSGSASVTPKLQPLFNYILWRIHQELDPVAALESFIFLCNDPAKVNYAKGFDIRYKRLEQLREVIGREDRDFKNRQMIVNRETQPENIEEDEVLFKPALRGSASTKDKTNVIDPNAFDRSTSIHLPDQELPQSPKQSQAQLRGGFSPAAPRSPRGNARGSRGRANGGPNARVTPPTVQPASQIDPDSFSRPRGGGTNGRGGRKLWVPT